MKRSFAVGAVAAILLLAGCSADSADSPSGSADGGADKAAGAPAPPLTADRLKEPATAPEGVNATAGPVEGRALIYKGDLTVRVDDVTAAAGKLTGFVTTAGGFISADKRTADSGQEQAWITVRVPSKQFSEVLGKLSTELGKELRRDTDTDDVTEAVIDLDTRIAAQRASVDSVRRMFSQAKALSEVVLLERELSSRQADLASLEAKKRHLDDLVSLSTISVSLVGPHTEVVEPEDDAPSFLGGLETGWNAFVSTVLVALAILGFLLPFLIALAIPVALIVWLSRIRSARRSRRTPPPPTTTIADTDTDTTD